jgi:hypothetical protein
LKDVIKAIIKAEKSSILNYLEAKSRIDEVIKRNIKVDPVYYFYNDLTPAQFDRLLKAAANNKQSLD